MGAEQGSVTADTLRGTIERITYHNEENGYTVAQLMPERAPEYQWVCDRVLGKPVHGSSVTMS